MSQPTVQPPEQHFVQGLGLFDSTLVVISVMIGSGIFIVSADNVPPDRQPRLDARGMGPHRPAHRRRGALLRRTGGHDAAGRRHVHLPARAFSPLWGFLYGWTFSP